MALTIPHIPQELFQTTQVDPSDVEGLVGRLNSFARSFAPFFYRKEQAALSRIYLEGLASDLHRKSVEPIAIAHHRPRQGLQRFAGQGKWEDAKVREELHRQVARDLGDPDGILVLDSSGTPKKGPTPSASRGSGAAVWGRWTTVRWASSWATSDRAVTRWSMETSTFLMNGPGVALVWTPAMSLRRSDSGPRSGSLRTC